MTNQSSVRSNSLIPQRYFHALTGFNSCLFYAFLLQVVILGSWFFPLILNIPKFLTLNVKENACVPITEEWAQKTLFLLWSTTVVAAMVLMAGLYCRIIYTLWFKRDPENQLTFQQRVSINKLKWTFFHRFTDDNYWRIQMNVHGWKF